MALNRTRRMMVVALALLANPAMAATVVVPGVGARTAVPCCGNNPRAPRVYVPGPNNGPPSNRTITLRGRSSPRAKRRHRCCNAAWCREVKAGKAQARTSRKLRGTTWISQSGSLLPR
jgi:hypothetical protein